MKKGVVGVNAEKKKNYSVHLSKMQKSNVSDGRGDVVDADAFSLLLL